ncbi:hypothetical protein ACQ4M3_13420 [Leptolyngbya sp. AN03gr2]|uniref:hypothetical protein n=1 Tax=unclassified Leptolyngbya TaxID=2650499 RepID=UPI003D3167BF
MKFQTLLKILSLSLALEVASCANATPTLSAQPSLSSSHQSRTTPTCDRAISTAIAQLSAQNIHVTSFQVQKVDGYHNVPVEVTHKLVILVEKLTQSNAYQRAANQLQSCHHLGLVTFGEKNSSFMVSIGKIQGRMQPFKPAGNAISTNGNFTIPWGYDLQ